LRAIRLFAVALALLFVGAACGDDDSTSATTTSAGETTTTTDGSEATTTTGGSEAGLDEDTANSALLAADDLSGSFEDGGWSYSDSPLPCDDQAGDGLDTTIPPRFTVGVELDGTDLNVAMIEEIRSFGSVDEASSYLDAVRNGLSCGTADFEGDSVTISPATDVTQDTLSDDASAWTLSTPSLQLVAIAARSGSELLLFTFASEAGADLSSLDNPVDIALGGVAADDGKRLRGAQTASMEKWTQRVKLWLQDFF